LDHRALHSFPTRRSSDLNAQPLQRTHQDACLWLHALDGRDHEHCAVENAQYTLDLRNEVGMAWRVDQIDVQALEPERRDGRLDRDRKSTRLNSSHDQISY